MKKMLAAMLALALFPAACPLMAGAAQRGRKGGAKQEARLKTKFDQLDTNKDGQIARAEWKGKAKAFDSMDANHDGNISFAEYKAAREKAAKNGKRGKGRHA
jgi:hypothetical protein